MPFSAGAFSRLYSWVTDAANGTKISSTRMDAEFDGIATALSACLLKDGTQTVTANIPMNSHKITGLADGTATGEALNAGQLASLPTTAFASTVTFNGGVLFSSTSYLAFTNRISPSQITSDQNDYAPSGIGTAFMVRLTSDASRNVTGISAGTMQTFGGVLCLVNVGSQNIVLKNQSASSTAANRFAIVADITLAADQTALLFYDMTSARWRCFGKN